MQLTVLELYYQRPSIAGQKNVRIQMLYARRHEEH